MSMAPHLRAAVAALALFMAWAPVSAAAGSTETEVAGYASKDAGGRQFARIVFDRAAPKPYNIGLDGRELILLFEQPVQGSFAALGKSLRLHVRRVRVTAKGRVVALTLRTEYLLTQATVEGALLIDLTPLKPVPPLKTGTARRKIKKPKPRISATTSGDVWERAIRKAMKIAPRSGAKKKLPKITMMPPKPAPRPVPKVKVADEGKRLAGIEPAAGTGLVIELPPSPRTTPVKKPVAKAKPAGKKPDPVVRAPDPMLIPPPAMQPPVAPPGPGESGALAGNSNNGSTGNIGAPPPAAEPPPGGPVRVRFSAGRANSAFSLHFDWPRPTTAAVFRRSGYLWVVFGAREDMEFSAALATGGTTAAALEQVGHQGGTVVRLALDRPLTPYVRRKGNVWTVEMMRAVADPVWPMRVVTEPEAAGGARVLVFTAGAGAAIGLPDPGGGGEIRVVPVAAVSSGVISDRDYPQFRILATAQGIAVRVKSSDVRLTPGRDAVAIGAAGGLKVAGGGASRNYPRALSPKKPIFEYAKWRRGGFDRFTENKQRMQAEVASSRDSERPAKRLELAQFYFANGFAAEALGALNLIDPNSGTAKDPKFRLLRGAAAVMANNARTAAGDLYPSELEGHPELALWRGGLRAFQGNWVEANREFGRAGDMFRRYAEPYRTRFILQAARASLAVRDHVQATHYLDLMNEKSMSRPQRTELKLIRGMIQKAEGSVKDALKSWAEVIDTRQGPSRVQAVLERIDLLTEQGKVSPGEAIDVLERLRFTWRGDALEFETLRRLGRYYTVARQHKMALLSWRRAVRFFPDHPDTPALKAKMRQTFTALFRDGMADQLPPLTAVALFEEFRSLVPGDADGARMVRDFVERLVAVDLLNRAGDILEKQLTVIPAGRGRATVGVRLAEIRLLDAQPARALTALDGSRSADLPTVLADRRRQVGARALIDTEKYDKALALLSGDLSREAAVLRGDIHWRRQDWKQAAAAFGLIAATIEPAAGSPLTEAESQLVLGWAASLALSEDRRGLTALRRRFDGVMEAGAHKDTYRVFASAISGPVTDYKAVITRLRAIDHFQAFIDAYRKEAEEAAKKAAAMKLSKAGEAPPPASKVPGQQAQTGQ